MMNVHLQMEVALKFVKILLEAIIVNVILDILLIVTATHVMVSTSQSLACVLYGIWGFLKIFITLLLLKEALMNN